MTNREIRYEMMKYCANNLGCDADDFLSDKNKVYSHNDKETETEFFRMICFGNAAVVKAHEKIYDWCKNFVSKYIGFRCFDGVQMSIICRELAKYDYTVSCGQSAIPDMNFNRKNENGLYNLRIIKKDEIKKFYADDIYGSFYPDDKEWHMMNYEEATEYIVANYDNGKVTGFAAADKCTEKIYEIGYETLPEYRQKGIATAVTVELTNLLFSKDIIPHMGFAWSNIASKNVAVKSGYIMAWSDMGVCDRNNWAEKIYRGEVE